MKKFSLLLTFLFCLVVGGRSAMAAETVTDVVTGEDLGFVKNTANYTIENHTIDGASGAVYEFRAMNNDRNASITFADDAGDHVGMVTTTSAGLVRSLQFVWPFQNNGRAIKIYGSNEPYTSTEDLYDESKAGTLLATLSYPNGKSLDIEGDYKYIGIKGSAFQATNITSIGITWEKGASEPAADPFTVRISSNNEKFGKAVFVDPASDENSIQATGDVTVKAIPLSDNSHFINWTDIDDNVVSTEAEFTYTGRKDIILFANFELRFSVTFDDCITVTTAKGESIESGSLVALGTSLTARVTVPEGQKLEALMVNGGAVSYDAEKGYTFTVGSDMTLSATFATASTTVTLNVTITGNGKGECFVAKDFMGFERYELPAEVEAGTTIFIKAAAAEGSTLTSVKVNNQEWLEYFYDVDGLMTLPTSIKADFNIVAEFTADSSAIDTIDADALTDAAVYTLQGVKVAGTTAPGIYIVVKNGRAVKTVLP